MKKKKHLSLEERIIIERLVQDRKSNKKIAKALGRSESTIWRERKRNCQQVNGGEYKSDVAEGMAKKRQKHERKLRISEGIWQKIVSSSLKCNQNDKSLKETKRDVSIAFSKNKKI